MPTPSAPTTGMESGGAATAALKMKHVKGIHEDDGESGANDAPDVLPRDVLMMQELLASMGATQHEPRVVHQLLEFVHRYVVDILVDAHEYAAHASKQTLEADDIRLAISSRLHRHYANVPARELLMEVAAKRNQVPLPPISDEYGVHLPPAPSQLLTQEHDEQLDDDLSTRETASDDAFGGRGDDGVSRREGTRNKKVARHPIAIRLQSR